MSDHDVVYNPGKRDAQKKEAWIKNIMSKLGYTREQAEEAFKRINPKL